MSAESERPPEQPGDDETPAEEPIAPDEAGRSQPAEPPAKGGGADDGPSPPGQDDGPEAGTSPEDAQAATDETVEAVEEVVEATGEAPEPAEETAQAADGTAVAPEAVEEFMDETPREKPEIPGADLEVDIVPEGSDPLGREAGELDLEQIEVPVEEPLVTEDEVPTEPEAEPEPRAQAVIDLAAGARYRATGKRKTAVARVILRPGDGRYTVNGRPLDEHFPRPALQRNIRQPLETVGYDARMDVSAKIHGGGISSQAGALRHGISRALIEADPNLRGELKRRGFLTRDPRVKERKKAGLKKARKRPQFSKR